MGARYRDGLDRLCSVARVRPVLVEPSRQVAKLVRPLAARLVASMRFASPPDQVGQDLVWMSHPPNHIVYVVW